MIFNFYPFSLIPCVPSLKPLRPPLLYDLLNSMINFGVEEKTSINKLAETASSKVFNFDYPLTPKMNKVNFEKMILNHFIMRRIGYETYTAWHIALETKLNEIMPEYNILLDSLIGWNLFNDGEKEERISSDNREINSTTEKNSNNNSITNNESNSINNSSSTNNLTTNSTTSGTSDRRNSAMPQNNITEVQRGEYLTNYDYDTNNSNDNSTSNGTSNNENTVNENSKNTFENQEQSKENSNTKDNNNFNETIKRDNSNKILAYKEFKESQTKIMTMIFNDLESIFYQLL